MLEIIPSSAATSWKVYVTVFLVKAFGVNPMIPSIVGLPIETTEFIT